MIGELTNHLWQSTLFAVAAGLLTAAFRGNKAQVRHWLWFSASMKFLLPFALLMSLGGHLERTPSIEKIAAPVVSPAVSEAMLQIAEPISVATSFAPAARHAIDWAPIAIFVWACGFAAMIVIRLRSWLRIRAAIRASNLIDIPGQVEIRESPGLLEPGVVGFFRPVLLLPEGIVERLTPLQLQAVLAHEICHVRRRDNLTSALHMMVEAVFWFHPFVWYIGARMVEERERACDEAVLSLGGEPRDYAEGILSVCKLYVESPLACVSGVTGANLKRRIEAIITNRTGQRLNRVKKFVLASAGVAVLIGPVALGLMIGIPNSVVRAQAPAAVPAPANAPAQAAAPPATPRATPPVAAAPDPIQDHRMLALLFDFGATTPDQQSRARQAALKFVRDQMGASDRLAVMTAEDGKATVASDFTDDKTVLESAIQNLNPIAASGSPLSGIEAAVKILGALPGKKALIYFSAPIRRGPDNQAEIDATVIAAQLANVAIYSIDMSAATTQPFPLLALGGQSMAPQPAPIQTPTPQQDSGAGPGGPNAKPLVFDAASIKPFSRGGGGRNGGTGVNPPISGGLRFPPGRIVSAPAGVTARKLILEAYHLTAYQLAGGPGWLDSDRFDLEAKAEGAGENQLRQMLQTLLAERFQLVLHRETKEMPVYAMAVGKNGPKLHEWKEGDPLPAFGSGGHAENFRDVGTIQRLADVLSAGPDLGRPVLDKTGLKGVYLFYVEWDAGEDFIPAMEQQLGLKLESQKDPVDNLVIDHIDKPTAN
jgi:uncharacterized protein (TIGR03435 family)